MNVRTHNNTCGGCTRKNLLTIFNRCSVIMHVHVLQFFPFSCPLVFSKKVTKNHSALMGSIELNENSLGYLTKHLYRVWQQSTIAPALGVAAIQLIESNCFYIL